MSYSLQPYLSHRIENVFDHLHEYEKTGGETSLHGFRVEIKKIRALIIFLQTLYPKQKLSKPAHYIRVVFREAGEIREYQLLQQWLTKTAITTFDKTYFPKHTLDELIHDFQKKTGDTKQTVTRATHSLKKYIRTVTIVVTEQYVSELYTRIQVLTRARPETIEWHELRKLIKQWMYAVNWLGAEAAGKTKARLLFYNRLQNAIGNWHDAEMIKDLLYRKQIYLSPDVKVQQDFLKAINKINRSVKYRERQVGEMLAKKK